MDQWKPGDIPCFYCADDWYVEPHEEIDVHLIGTYVFPECGDGCCWNRGFCEECYGTGKENNEYKESIS